MKPNDWKTAARRLLAASCLVAAGCQPAAKEKPDATEAAKSVERAPVVVTATTAGTRTVRRTIPAVGTLYGFEKATLAPKVEGRVASWNFETGDRVKPGDVLLQIDTADFELAVAEAQRGLEQELARLGVDEIPGKSFDLEALPSVSRSRLLLENSRKRFERQQSLVESRAAAREAFELAETELRVSEASLKQARMDARWSLAAVRHREAVLAVARQRLADCTLVAPPLVPAAELAGRDYVVTKRMVAVGEVVRAVPATPVYELTVDTLLKLRAFVPERAIGLVHEKLPVEVRVDAYPDETFAATMRRVNPTIDPRSRTFEIEAVVPNDERRLRPGGFAKVEIVLDESDAALVVPPSSIVSLAGIDKVFVFDGERVREIRVTPVERGADWVEVRGEVQEGDRIVTSGQSQLFDGARATLREEAP